MKYTEDQLTPWFAGSVKPVRVGVYQRQSTERTGFDYGEWLHYSYWDGSQFCMSESTMDYAEMWGRRPNKVDSRSSDQNTPWRGLAQDPSKSKGSKA